MAETLEELTYDYEDEGTLVRKEIDRAVLTKGSWATVMFLFQAVSYTHLTLPTICSV